MTETLRVLDTFAGLGGAMAAFEERGHEVVTIDKDACFEPTICRDLFDVRIGELKDLGPFDFIWASFPCTTFTVMAISQNWESDGGPHPGILASTADKHHRPKRGACYRNIALVEWTVEIINQLEPRAFMLENPRGMARNLEVLSQFDRRTVTYCQYGMPYMKPTDLWGGFPPTLDLRDACKPGAKCHQQAPRGARKRIQGRRNGYDPIRDAFAELNDRRGGRGFDQKGAPIVSDTCQEELSGTAVEETSTVPTDALRLDLLQVDPMEVPASRRKAALRSLVPYELSLEVCQAMEQFDGHIRNHEPGVCQASMEAWA